VSEHHRLCAFGRIVLGGEPAPEQRLDAKGRENLRRYPQRRDFLRIAYAGDTRRTAVPNAEAVERAILVSER
jgi:hypothetical protein